MNRSDVATDAAAADVVAAMKRTPYAMSRRSSSQAN